MQNIWVSLPAILHGCVRLEVAEDVAQLAYMQHRENAVFLRFCVPVPWDYNLIETQETEAYV